MIYLSVTTIPSRINNFISFYKNIFKGVKVPDYIILNVYPSSLRGQKLNISQDIQELDKVIIINHNEDHGPILKFLGVFENFINQDDIFIYCDDDIIYDKNWLKNIIQNIIIHPNKISGLALNSGVNTFCRFRYFNFNGFNAFLRGFAGVGFYKKTIEQLNKLEIIHFLDSFEKQMSDDLIISYFINKYIIQCSKVYGNYTDFCNETPISKKNDSISQGVNGRLLPNKQRYHLICLEDLDILKYFDIESYVFGLNKGDKTIKDEFDLIKKKLINREYFSFIRFGDGEIKLLSQENYQHLEYTFLPNQIPIKLSLMLKNSLEYKDDNYLIGITCGCLESKDNFRKNLFKKYNINKQNLTFATLFCNIMNFRFKKEIIPIIKNYPIILVSNENTKLDLFKKNGFNVKKWFPVSYNAWKNYDKILESVLLFQKKNNIKNHLFILCAGPISNIIAFELYKLEKKNIYFDFGSSLDQELGLGLNTRNYNSLLGWKSICTCNWTHPTKSFHISCDSSNKSKIFRFFLRIISFLYKIINILLDYFSNLISNS